MNTTWLASWTSTRRSRSISAKNDGGAPISAARAVPEVSRTVVWLRSPARHKAEVMQELLDVRIETGYFCTETVELLVETVELLVEDVDPLVEAVQI